MKNILYGMVFFLIVFAGLSCQKKEHRVYLPVEAWDGQETNHLARNGLPVSIVWFRGSQLSSPYKGFCQAEEIKEIVDQLMYPEIDGPVPDLPLILGNRNVLCLFYYEGRNFVERVVTIEFDIDEEGVFWGPRGKSLALGKLLQEKEESGLARYTGHIYPYNEERINRFESEKK